MKYWLMKHKTEDWVKNFMLLKGFKGSVFVGIFYDKII